MDPAFAVQAAQASMPPDAVASGGATPSADPSSATPPAAAAGLPSLNPADSPYQPLSLPEANQPSTPSAALPDQQPIRDLGAVSRAGAIAYYADQALRSAAKGYDAARMQHATQFNKKMNALGTLQQQLGKEYQTVYNEVGSTPKADGTLPTPQEILDNPKVKLLHNQVLATHQATLQAVNGYLPPLQTDKKTGKTKEKKNLLERMFNHDEPDEALRAYSEAATQLGPTAFYQVATPQQLQAMAEKRKGLAAGQTADTATAQMATKKAGLQSELVAAEQSGDAARIDKAKKALEDFSEATSPYRRPSSVELDEQEYQTALAAGQVPKDANGVPLSRAGWKAAQAATGRATAPHPPSSSPWAQGLTAYAKENNLDPNAWSTIRAYERDRYSARNPLAERRFALAQRNSDIASANLALRRSSNDFNEFEKIEKQLGPDMRIQATAQAADDYTTHPDGPGDVALTLAFFEVAKAANPGSGSGIRFTKQEQDLITGARGWADAAQSNVQRWGKGTLYDDKQRAQMAKIIQMAAKRSNEATADYLTGARQLAPKATAAATASGGAAGGGGGAGRAGGSAGKIGVVDPKGKTHYFDSQDQADNFKKLAGIK